MVKPENGGMDTIFYRVMEICSAQPVVFEHVVKNHDDNLWWPLKVTDPRTRMIVAGLSTRISYNMITTFSGVIDDLVQYPYEQIVSMNDESLSLIIGRLGLIKTRLTYVRSVAAFIAEHWDHVGALSNTELIELISDQVKGASYKVAQCCTLYARGYYCGVMPVDSGMKDMLLPCLGVEVRRGAIGHEDARRELERLVTSIDLRPILGENGYAGEITVPDDIDPTWWAHLVLIYFKRFFCNQHKPENCPLYQEFGFPAPCKRD